MNQRFIHSKIIIKYILIFHLIKYIISSDIQLINKICLKYISQLDIECSKFEENENGILKCTKWNSSNILGFIDIPEECLNKEYNLDILAKNINPLIKINSNIYIEKETFIQLKKKEVKIILDKKAEIDECISLFTEYQAKCSFNLSYYKKENHCKEWLKKHDKKEFKFCFYLLEDFFQLILPKSKNKIERKNIILNDTNFNDIEYIFKDNINNTIRNLSEGINDKKYYKDFITEKSGNINDIEKSQMNSIKDCIEYGLNPLNEDLIICTKYE